MTLGELALNIALGENGVCEKPPGSNRGLRVDVYLRSVGLDPEHDSYPWCAAFVSWAVREATLRAGGPHRWRGSGGVSNLLEYNRALAVVLPQVGDVFIHLNDDGHGHCGFVTGVSPMGGLATLEGNTDRAGSRTGGSVMHQNRPGGYTAAFLRPG
jgi:hypothetical protein